MNMDKYVIRMAQEKDKARILEIYAYARNLWQPMVIQINGKITIRQKR